MRFKRRDLLLYIFLPCAIYSILFFAGSEIVEHMFYQKVSDTTIHYLHFLRAVFSTLFVAIVVFFGLKKSLSRQEHQLASICRLLDLAREGFIGLNQDGNIISLNKRAENLLGDVRSDQFKEWMISLRTLLKHQRSFECLSPDRSRFLKVTALESKLDGLLLLLQDVTDEKRVEEQWLATEKMASIGRLAAGLAHEIGTPLNIISGRVEMIEAAKQNACNACEGRAACALDKHTGIIFSQIERISRLIRQLLTQAKDSVEERQYFDMNSTVHQIIELLRPVAEEKKIQLNAELQPDLPNYWGSANQFQQVLINLLTNAIDATDKKGSTIRVSTSAENQRIVLKVQDGGCGISAEDLTKIFDPFFTTKEPGKGTGLGLTVTSNIIHAHQGTIQVESKIDEGTRFVISLPNKLDSSQDTEEENLEPFERLATHLFPHFS